MQEEKYAQAAVLATAKENALILGKRNKKFSNLTKIYLKNI